MTNKATPYIHLCRFTQWSAPTETVNFQKKQWRNCVVCNRVQDRRILSDYTQLNAIKAALESLK